MTEACVCKDILCEYRCGECQMNFMNICELYLHISVHRDDGSFYFDNNLKTAYPRDRFKLPLKQNDPFNNKTISIKQGTMDDLKITGYNSVSSSSDTIFDDLCHTVDKLKSKTHTRELVVGENEEYGINDGHKVEMVVTNIQNITSDTADNMGLSGINVDTHSEELDMIVERQYNENNTIRKCYNNDSYCYTKTNLDHQCSKRTTDEPYKCQFYDECFKSSYYRLNNQKLKHEKSVKANSPDGYQCLICGRCYSRRVSLLAHHRRKHVGECVPLSSEKQRNVYYRYKCCYCDNKYYLWTQMVKHSKAQHRDRPVPQEKRWQCEVCTQVFQEFSSFKQHFGQQHDKFRKQNYLCEVCGFETQNQQKIRNHRRIHCRHNRFDCSVCSYRTYDKSIFKKHYQTHTGEKDYVCQHCGKAFRQHTSLDRHILRHTGKRPYPCQVCGKTFRTSTTRKRHTDTHKNIKEYTCDVCGKQFVQRSNLVAHQRQHTGEKPYRCDFCGEQFTHNVSRKNHMAKKHNFKTIVNL